MNRFGKITPSDRSTEQLRESVRPYIPVNIHKRTQLPYFHALQWSVAEHIDPRSIETVRASGDREVSRFSRHKDSSIVISVGRKALSFVEHCRKDSSLAVAVISKGAVHIGLLPEEVKFGYDGTTRYATAALTLGRKPLEAAMGVWIPQSEIAPNGTLVVPTGLELLGERVPINTIQDRYPGTPLLSSPLRG